MRPSPFPESFPPAYRRLFNRLDRPDLIQRFIDDLPYNKAATCLSPLRALECGTAQCMEGAVLAASILHWHGYPPLLLDLEAVRDDDHVLAVFRSRGGWGAIAKSNYAGLRFREPVYRSLRELAMSYFEHYYNLRREKTLRAYSRPVNLRRFDARSWIMSREDVWFIPEHLCEIPHTPLLTGPMEQSLTRVDRRLFAAGLTGRQ